MSRPVIGMRSCRMRVHTSEPVPEKRHRAQHETDDARNNIRERVFHLQRELRSALWLRASQTLRTINNRVAPYTGPRS